MTEEEGIGTHTSNSSSQHLEVAPEATSSQGRGSSKRLGGILSKPPAKKRRETGIRMRSGTNPNGTSPNSSSLPFQDPTWDDVQLVRYAMETLAAVGDRSHAFGLAVRRPKVTLWYFDCCGVIRSQSLSITSDFLEFVKFLSALVYMEAEDLGFNCLFTDPDRTEMRQDLSRLSIEIPCTHNVSLELQEVLERRPGLVGWASLVYKAQMRSGGEEETAATKPSWQHVKRKSKYAILRKLYEDEDAVKYIVEAFYGWDEGTVSSKRDQFGRFKPSVDPDRVLRYVILEELPPVTQLSRMFHIPWIGWSVLRGK